MIYYNFLLLLSLRLLIKYVFSLLIIAIISKGFIVI